MTDIRATASTSNWSGAVQFLGKGARSCGSYIRLSATGCPNTCKRCRYSPYFTTNICLVNLHSCCHLPCGALQVLSRRYRGIVEYRSGSRRAGRTSGYREGRRRKGSDTSYCVENMPFGDICGQVYRDTEPHHDVQCS